MSVTQQYRWSQIAGPLGLRTIGCPYTFSVEIVSYTLGAVGWKIVFYDKSDKTQAVGELSSDIGDGTITGIEFNLVQTGCGDFSLVLGVDPSTLPFTVEYNQGIEIYLYHDANPWYAGYILKKTPAGSTERPWKIEGAGYYNQLETCIVDQDYATIEIAAIVHDLMSSYVEEKTDIVYAEYKIVQTAYTVSDIRFDHTKAKKAIQQLADLAQNYIFGVDEERELFFHGTDPTVNPAAIFHLGTPRIKEFDLEEDSETVRNRIYVKAGLLSGSPQTNVQATCQDYNSQVLYGIREDVMTAPSIRDATDAERWGNWQVDQQKRPQQKAKVSWVDCSGGKIKPTGKAQITDINGTAHRLAIEKVSYKISDAGIDCALQLGQPEKSLGGILKDLLFDVANEELLQQQNVSQL